MDFGMLASEFLITTGNRQRKHNPCCSFYVFVTEPSDAANAGMAKQTEGSRLALRASPRPQIFGW